MLHIPQVFPATNLMYPFSPQFVPQSFLRTQFPFLIPTSKAAKLRLDEQIFKTPEVYCCHFIASTATLIGPFCRALAKLEQSEISVYPLILNGPPSFKHFWTLAVYGYSFS